MLEKIFIKFIRKFPAEFAHRIAVLILRLNLISKKKRVIDNSLKVNLFGFNLSNPIGLAAGFDKNAEALSGLLKQNFSFIEIGTVTPHFQKGNDKPRVFRISEEKLKTFCSFRGAARSLGTPT